MHFYYILHKSSICHLLWISQLGLYSLPPPLIFFRKEIENLFIKFCVPFPKLFVEFVILLIKIWPKNINFCLLQLILETSEIIDAI